MLCDVHWNTELAAGCVRTKWLASISMPWVKLIDPIVGEKVGMLVEVELEDGSTAAGLFVHKLLSESVG